MKIDIKDLVNSVPAALELGARIGWPDDPTFVEVRNPKQFAACLDTAMRAFHDLRPGSKTLMDVDVNDVRKSVQVRVVQAGRSEHHGNVEAAVAPSFEALRLATEENNGHFHYWGGNNYVDVEFPHRGKRRASFPEVDHLPWDQRYRYLLKQASWKSLRRMAFRFSSLADAIANRCIEFQMGKALIPSVGLCIHPWLFANYGLTVTATDLAGSALAALSDPDQHPKIYSRAAYERWDISTSADYASYSSHPEHFGGMPALEDEPIRSLLRKRIALIHSDWASIPLPAASVDLVFATNAVPRESAEERTRVLGEWLRVLRPGGVLFIAQHHPPANWNVEELFLDRGLRAVDFLGGQRPAESIRAGFQTWYSSG